MPNRSLQATDQQELFAKSSISKRRPIERPFALDLAVTLPHPRRWRSAEFATLEERILNHLFADGGQSPAMTDENSRSGRPSLVVPGRRRPHAFGKRRARR